jgi:hypothetical protein
MKQLFDGFRSTSLEVLPNLKERYGLLLRRDLLSVQIMHKAGQVWVEYTVTDQDNYSFDNKKTVKRFGDLDNEAGSPYFSVSASIFENGRYLVEELPPTVLAQMADIFEASAAAALANYAGGA